MSTNKGVPASHNKPPSPGGAKYDSPGQSESASDALGTDTPRTLLPLLPRREEGRGYGHVVGRGACNTEVKGVRSCESDPAQLLPLQEGRGSALRVTNADISGDTRGGMLDRLSGVFP